MTENRLPPSGSYAATFCGEEAITAHRSKFLHPIDRIRHEIETQFLRSFAVGRLFDCTVGLGRFIGQLPSVTDYCGMDLSAELIEFARSTFPRSDVSVGDLRSGIDHPDNAFETVVCLRSLSTIGHLQTILPEMVRIAAPGGHLLMDYGRRPATVDFEGHEIRVDDEPFDAILGDLPVTKIAEVHCDGLLCYSKQTYPVYRLLGTRLGELFPRSVLFALEQSTVRWLWQRRLVAYRKQQ